MARRQHGVVHRRQAIAVGMTARSIEVRVAQGAWYRMFPSVYRLAAAPESWRQRLLGACLAAGPAAAASHRSAASLWALDGFEESGLDVTVPGLSRRVLKIVTIHRTRALPRADVTVVDAIPVTKVPRTIIDLAAVVTPEQLEAALDSALREGRTSVAYLERRLDAVGSNGRTGTAALQLLLDTRRHERPAESVKELEVIRLLMAAGLPRPQRQYELRRQGRVVARFDLAYPDRRIAVEYDSYRHHYGRQAWARDHARHNAATAEGWLVFRVTGTDPNDVAAIARAYAGRSPVSN